MRTHLLVAIAACLITSQAAFAADEFDITDSTCSVGYINEVAQKQGLEKAKMLTESCIAQGYQDLEGQMKEAGSAILEHYEAAKDFIDQKTDEYSEKAVNIKNELMR